VPATSAAAEPAGAVEPVAPAAAAAPAAAPAVRAPAPAPAAPPPPKPDPPYIAAAKNRKRIPYWALPVLVALPIWGFIYATTLEPPTEADDPLAVGQEIYSSQCAVCHGASGGGGVGPALSDGDTVATFPEWRDHALWVREGAASANPDGTYGDPDREGGQRSIDDLSGVMPAFPDLSDADLLAVVRYEREGLSGAAPEEEQELVDATEGVTDPTEALAGG
jgi:mono/diheme cytochrome c family protein